MTLPIFSKVNRLRTLKSVALFQLLPAANTAGLDANHILPAILGLKVAHGGRLVDPRVPHNHVLEVVADEAEALPATLGDDDGVLGALGRGVYAVRLAGEVDYASLCLCPCAVDLVDVGCVFEAGNFDGANVLDEGEKMTVSYLRFIASTCE